MRTVQGSMLQSLRTVDAFLEEHADKLAGVVSSGSRQKLNDAIAELQSHAAEQTGSGLASQGATRKQLALRKALLRDHMAPIARIAKADLPQTPEIEPLRMPKGRPSIEKLAAAAYGMANAAAPFIGVFTTAGLPADFIAQLGNAADALVLSLSERSQSRGRQSGATKGLKSMLSAGRRIVHVLDAFVKSALKDDPALLANWNSVKRVQLVAVRPATPTPPAPPAPPAPSDPAPIPTPTPAPVPAPAPR